MLSTIDRATAIRELDVEHAAVRSLIDRLTDAEKTRPDTIRYGLYWDQKLSFKDLLAHLITYEAYTIEAVEAWQRGEEHPVIEQMQTESGGRAIHYGGIESRAGQTLAQTLDEWERTQDQLMTVIRGLNDSQWTASAPYTTDEPTDLASIIEVILVAPPRPPYRHLPVHIPDTEAYIKALRG